MDGRQAVEALAKAIMLQTARDFDRLVGQLPRKAP
jgi:hypothetical protein